MTLSYEHKIHLIIIGFLIAICGTLICPLPFIVRISLIAFFVVLAILISLLRAWWLPRTSKKLPIFLMLHSVSDEVVDPSCPNNSLHLATLETLIINLKSAGYHFRSAIDAIEKPKARSIVLTFDDGLIDNYTNLFPILKRQNIQVTCFITSRGENGNPKFLSAENVKEMHQSGLVEFGGHTSHHILLGNASKEEAFREIQENYNWIHKITGTYPKCFAYPCGSYTIETIEILKAIGYQYGFTMQKRMRPVQKDPYRIHRQIIPRGKDDFSTYLIATRGKYKI